MQTAPPILRPLPQSNFLFSESLRLGPLPSSYSLAWPHSECAPLPQRGAELLQLWAGRFLPGESVLSYVPLLPTVCSACRKGHCSRTCPVGSSGRARPAQDQSGPDRAE